MEYLPLELVSKIGDNLDVLSLTSLRLASKPINHRFTPSYCVHLRELTVDLSRSALQRLCELSASPELGPSVRNLGLVSLYHHEATLEHQSLSNSSQTDRPDPAWLAEKKTEHQAFTTADMSVMLERALRNFKKLEEVRLDAAVIFHDDRRGTPDDLDFGVWQGLRAQVVPSYRVLMSALERSQIELESLFIYGDAIRCGIPTDEVGSIFEKEGFAFIGRHLKQFAISLATIDEPINPTKALRGPVAYLPLGVQIGEFPDHYGHQTKDNGASSEGVVALLQLMPQLTSLRLQLYRTVHWSFYHYFLPNLLQHLHLPRLRDLTLQGFAVTAFTLEAMLGRHPQMQTLTLRYILLREGTWKTVAAALSAAGSLTHLHLSTLKEWGHKFLVNLEPRNATLDTSDPTVRFHYHPCYNGSPCWHTRYIDKEELRHGLDFRYVSEQPSACLELDYWAETTEIECGPPLLYTARHKPSARALVARDSQGKELATGLHASHTHVRI
jgi:hypothetical protein